MGRKRRTVRRTRRQSQKGGVRFKRKPHVVDKIAESVAMGLSGPSPSFAKMGVFFSQASFQGYKRQRPSLSERQRTWHGLIHSGQNWV